MMRTTSSSAPRARAPSSVSRTRTADSGSRRSSPRGCNSRRALPSSPRTVSSTSTSARRIKSAAFPITHPDQSASKRSSFPIFPQGAHRTRTVAFGPDGMLYLAVGSSCNICVEDQPIRATVSRANPDGSDLQIIATGLRNPVGLAFQPGTDLLWATVNERDNQGNEIPPDLVTIVTEGANYGWPACLPPDAAPQEPGADCSGVNPPTVGIQAHSAPLGLAFLERREFRVTRWRPHRRPAWIVEPGATGRAKAAVDRFRGRRTGRGA